MDQVRRTKPLPWCTRILAEHFVTVRRGSAVHRSILTRLEIGCRMAAVFQVKKEISV
jgi:hypothetical protein